VEEGEARASIDAAPTEQGTGVFRPGPGRDPVDPLATCRFLAREAEDGTLGPAGGVVDPAHRCVAIGEPLPQSSRQQELVCLVGAHVNCPRYLRGLLIAGTPPPPPRREPISPAVIAATLILVAAIATSFGFLAVRGGFALALPNPSADLVAAIGSPSPTPASTPVAPSPSVIPTETPPSSPSPTPTLSPTATPAPTATPSPQPPTATPTPAPSSNRYAVLTKCPSTPDCWIYVIRAGDNLRSIANWFGVNYDRMIAMNPNLRTPIHPGDSLRIPTPTR
jgi:hypothetical protein